MLELLNQVDVSERDIVSLFAWRMENVLGCSQCPYNNIMVEDCFDLSIDFVDKENAFSLLELLEFHFKQESLEYTCDECDSKSANMRHFMNVIPTVKELFRFKVV